MKPADLPDSSLPEARSSASRIGLGTVQFGLDYGITNRAGRPAQDKVEQICLTAAEAGIDTLDTAHLYGDSEAVIGSTRVADAFRVVTKTPKFSAAASSGEAVDVLDATLTMSLDRLRRPSVDALLFHEVEDLLGPHGDALWRAMERVRSSGLASKIGVSVYHGRQIDAALDRYPIEIVQVPFNPLDRRLIDGGQLDRLAAVGVEVHARSLFLQGLLLQSPDLIEPRFGVLRDAVAEMRSWASGQGLTPIQGVLRLALAETRIDRFIVGVTSAPELEDIVSATQSGQGAYQPADFVSSVALDPRHLDPSRWAELV
ncbi:aldo/keto reductase [Sphingomonas sp. KR3-1]|uniref:aldo/keto reductase n=1 Tax=Sphingomonas sp. KR3-1 TaxID=3156611 RepID=UPI0032B4818E